MVARLQHIRRSARRDEKRGKDDPLTWDRPPPSPGQHQLQRQHRGCFAFIGNPPAEGRERERAERSPCAPIHGHVALSTASFSSPPPLQQPLSSLTHAPTPAKFPSHWSDRGQVGSNFSARSGEDRDTVLLKNALKFFDADFFNEDKVKQMANGALELNVPAFQKNRKLVASINGGLHDPSVLVFNPSWDTCDTCHQHPRFNYTPISGIQRPEDEEDIAFMTILELGELIKTKQITSRELTEIFLRRMKGYDHVLEAVVTYTEDLAYSQAKKADELLEQGVYLGPLHGIPYGLKDIISVPHYKTTWGSKTFKNQVLDVEAWVYKRLRSAGAVLIAKLATGSLAYDDIWFGGRTRNPWNIEEFSTGSSAGPAAGTSAGLFVLLKLAIL
ncbi:hypothetical protein ACLOJK_023809 [Asimina triloba]